MLSRVLFLIFLAVGVIHTATVVNESCEAKVYDGTGPCQGLIQVTTSCKESTVNLATTRFKSCDAVDLTWAYPINNLTITIETPFTQQRQPYAIHFDNKRFRFSDFPLYRILNGRETKIESTDDVIIQNSDANYQIILKVQAETTVSLYVLWIDYSVTKS